MEQIVKIFVHQNYFIENDLVVDYNVEQGALANISYQDWIALIPKGWIGVDDQVAFKNVDVDCDKINLAIKSITLEKNCFQNVVECEKFYQLIYISQQLEILGRSEYFTFLHQTSTCNCSVSSNKNTESKENSEKNKIPYTFSRKIIRRQSPTPHEFYKLRPQLQNDLKSEKSNQLSVKKCVKCNASSDFAANSSIYLAKIQDLTIKNEKMEQYLMKLEADLTNTLEVLNKLFKLNKAISQQKDDIQKFIDDVVDGLLKDDKVTFWARDQQFSVVREFPDENQISLLSDDTSTINRPLSSLNEEHLKAIIGQQEQTIQNLVTKIKELLEIFVKVNTQSAEHHSALTTSKNKIHNISFVNIKGTTYFSPTPHISDTMNDVGLFMPNNFKNKYGIENIAINKKMNNGTNNEIYNTKYPCTWESKLNDIADKSLTLEDWEKYENEYTPEKYFNSSLILEKSNEFESNKSDKNYNFEKSNDF